MQSPSPSTKTQTLSLTVCANANSEIISSEMNFNVDSIKLLTMHSIKGLEFKVVILIDINQNVIPYTQEGLNNEEMLEDEISERKLLYVAMTRAKRQLYIFSSGTPSKFIDQIEKQYLCMQIGAKISAVYNLPYEKYYFQEIIKDINSSEETMPFCVAIKRFVSITQPRESESI